MELFGGAIVADLPKDLIDVSRIRQVPDNQEVFVYPGSDVSLVIEVLQRVPEPNDIEAVKFHFEALAHDNDATSSTMQVPFIMHGGGDQPSPIILHGSQRVHKFNATVADDVDIYIALFRVHSGGKSADVVVSKSIPKGSKGKHTTADFASLISSIHIVDYETHVVSYGFTSE